jgi:hypothetical protein
LSSSTGSKPYSLATRPALVLLPMPGGPLINSALLLANSSFSVNPLLKSPSHSATQLPIFLTVSKTF